MRQITKTLFFFALAIWIISSCSNQKNIATSISKSMKTPFENHTNKSADYYETITYYTQLTAAFEEINMLEVGLSDAGLPIHTIVVDVDGLTDPQRIRQAGRIVLFINNAIHPGEPCGVDASMMFVRDMVQKPTHLADVSLVVIPFYNIGGGLNRGSHSRVNQDGPAAYGFRGNARNLDLNRDFIKCDSKNAMTFNQTFAKWRPEVFVDTHTSNGADYTYTMTLIATQKDKLEKALSDYLVKRMLPQLYADMEARGWEMIPYVYARNTPDEGIAGFLDLPRYSSGYGALHHAISFMPETHMLKPFADRVRSTQAFLETMIKTMAAHKADIVEARAAAEARCVEKSHFPLNWSMDTEAVDTLIFKGYEAAYRPSAVSGLSRLYYDRTKPYEKAVPFYNTYKERLSVRRPAAYIIPQAYDDIIERLRWNGVRVHRLTEAVTLDVEQYYIESYETVDQPYEGHYLHYNTAVRTKTDSVTFHRGDLVVLTNQKTNRYIVETLEPQAPDSYFSWNFFDGILMQKEYFSSYVFEDLAAEILKRDMDVRKALHERRARDTAFAEDARAQLDFIYKRSAHYEFTHNRYPVCRLLEITNLPLSEM